MVKVFGKIKNRFLRISVIALVVIVLLGGIVIIFISPIAKYYIEKNSIKLLRRQVDIGLLYVNPFTGHVYAHNVTMYEKDKRKKFISIGGLAFNVSISGLLSKKFDFYSIHLNHLWVNIVENKAQFNFDDIFKKDSTKPEKQGEPAHYYVRDISVTNSEVEYSEISIPVHYYVTKFNAQCPSIEWDIDSSTFKYDFTFLDNSGTVKGLFKLNFKNLNYEMTPVFSHFDLKSVEQYIKEFSNYGNFAAFLNANIDAKGNFHEAQNLLVTGKLEITDFHFGKNPTDDYLRFKSLVMNMDTLSPINKKYFMNTILLDSFFVKYERYDSLDNFTRIFGPGGENVEKAENVHYSQNIIFQIAHFISQIAQNIVNSQYRIKDLEIINSKMVYADYSLIEKFSLLADPIVITAKNIDTKTDRTYLKLQTKVEPFGDININFDVKPTDFGNFNLIYDIDDFPIPLFNPYLVTYTSYPFHKGTLDLSGNWHVVDKKIISTNHIIVADPTLAVQIKNHDAKKIPMHIVMFFIRDVNRQIDVQVPITGNLNDPKYHLWKEILHVLENIVIKPASFPYTTVKLARVKDDDDYLKLEWQLIQSKMTNEQEGQLKKISSYLFSHPNAQLTIVPHYFESEEKETLLMFEAKKKFYSTQHHVPITSLTKDDSIAISKMSIKDTFFLRYLNRMTKDTMDFTLQGKCLKLIGKEQLNTLYAKLLAERKNQILSFFNDKNIGDRVTFEKGINEIPPTGFSQYRFYYKGDLPPVLANQ